MDSMYRFLVLITFIFTGNKIEFETISAESRLLPRIEQDWQSWQRAAGNLQRLDLIRELFFFILTAWNNSAGERSLKTQTREELQELIKNRGVEKMISSLEALREKDSSGVLDLEKSLEEMTENLGWILIRLKDKITRAERSFTEEQLAGMVAKLDISLDRGRINNIYNNFNKELQGTFTDRYIPLNVKEELKKRLFQQLLERKLRKKFALYGSDFTLSDLRESRKSRKLPALEKAALEIERILRGSLYLKEIESKKVELLAELFAECLEYSEYSQEAGRIWKKNK